MMNIDLTWDMNLLSDKDYSENNSVEGGFLACWYQVLYVFSSHTSFQRINYLAYVGLDLINVNFGDFIFSACSKNTVLIWTWTFSGFAFIIPCYFWLK